MLYNVFDMWIGSISLISLHVFKREENIGKTEDKNDLIEKDIKNKHFNIFV